MDEGCGEDPGQAVEGAWHDPEADGRPAHQPAHDVEDPQEGHRGEGGSAAETTCWRSRCMILTGIVVVTAGAGVAGFWRRNPHRQPTLPWAAFACHHVPRRPWISPAPPPISPATATSISTSTRTSDFAAEITRLKKEKNAVVLAHYYQDGPIQDIADYVGRFTGLEPAGRDYGCGHHRVCGRALHGGDRQDAESDEEGAVARSESRL